MKDIKKLLWGTWAFGFLIFLIFTPMSYSFHGTITAVLYSSIGVIGAVIMIISAVLNIIIKDEVVRK